MFVRIIMNTKWHDTEVLSRAYIPSMLAFTVYYRKMKRDGQTMWHGCLVIACQNSSCLARSAPTNAHLRTQRVNQSLNHHWSYGYHRKIYTNIVTIITPRTRYLSFRKLGYFVYSLSFLAVLSHDTSRKLLYEFCSSVIDVWVLLSVLDNYIKNIMFVVRWYTGLWHSNLCLVFHDITPQPPFNVNLQSPLAPMPT